MDNKPDQEEIRRELKRLEVLIETKIKLMPDSCQERCIDAHLKGVKCYLYLFAAVLVVSFVCLTIICYG